jgi:hypothetical protein
MNREIKNKLIESLSDIKRIRFNTGNIIEDIYFIGITILLFIFLNFTMLFLLLGGRFLFIGIFNGILAITMSILRTWILFKQEKKEIEFLKKYGANRGKNK